jgi:tRNA(Arg) A34 adenosine deaminase TadA
MTHEELLREAIRLSVENVANGGGPFGAVVARDGEIVAAGANAVTLDNDPTAHAEVVAIRAACRALGTFDLAGCALYSSCEPCPMCLGAVYWANLDALYFAADRHDAAAVGFDDAFLYGELPQPYESRRLPTRHLTALIPDAQRAFLAWREKSDRTEY